MQWTKFLILLLVLGMTSCLQKSESITPIVQPMTLAQLQRSAVVNMANNSALSANSKSEILLSNDPSIFFLSIKYNIKNIDVFEMANIPNTFEQMAHSILGSLAKIVLSIAGPRKIDINNIEFSIPKLDIDYTVIKSIKIKRVFLQYAEKLDAQNDFAADFSFIDSIDLSQEVNIANMGKYNSLLLTYDQSHNRCLFKCLDFNIQIDNVLDLIKPNSTVKLKPVLSIAHMPAIKDLKLDGYIEILIGLKLPF